MCWIVCVFIHGIRRIKAVYINNTASACVRAPVLELKIIICTTNLLQHVLCGDRLEHVLLGRLLDLTAHQQLVQNEVGLFKVEDYVQLTHLEKTQARRQQVGLLITTTTTTYTSKVLVQQLDVSVDNF